MSDEIAEQDKTPVTLITGFLGSGKTTLVNYILKEQRDWKICVVENEFGEVPIDNALVEENLAAKEDIITMDNGCVCCSIRGDLVRTFGMLVSRRKTFDAIIIETTGVADPSPIIFTFNSNVLLQDNFRLDSVVCLVDSKHIGIHLDEKKPDGNVNEAENQIAFADRIILNKLDLVGNEELEELEERIRSINSFAKLIKTERSRVPLDQILNLNSFSLEKLVEMDPTLMEEDDEHDHEHSHDHGSCTLDHDHTDGCGGHVHDEHCHHDHDSDHVHDEHCGHGDGHEHGHDHHDDHHGHHEHHKEKHDHNEHHHKEHHHDEHHHDKHHDEHHHDKHHDEHHHDKHHDEHHHDKHHDEHHHDKHHDEHHHHKDEHVAKKKKKTHNLSLITSVGFTIEGLLDVPRFNTFMTQLLQVKAADIYRSKGVLAFADQGDLKFVFQGVHDQVQFGPSEKPWGPDEPRLSKMVFIGKNLDHEHFRENLLQCTIDPQNAKISVHKRQ